MRFEDAIQDMVEARDDQMIADIYRNEHALTEAMYANKELVQAVEQIMSEQGYHLDDDSDKMDELMIELGPEYGYDVSIWGGEA